MGGRGSGRHAGLGLTVDLCHRTHSVDLDWLRRQMLLSQGRWATLTWSVRREKTGSIRFTLKDHGVLLSYRTRSRGEEWREIEEVVPLVRSETNFSGQREWFQCLKCLRRCRILYGGTLFRCRKCQGLRYETQYEPSFARAATCALKIRDKLGGKGGIDDPFPPKPKGMHWRTYERMRGEAEKYERGWAVGFAGKFGHLGDWS